MDNFVQNTSIENIIPANIQVNQEQLNELVESIKKYGIIEPLLVRQKNGKYEIIAGKKRYQAAKIIGLKEVPILIRNIDPYFYLKSEKNNKKNTVTSINISGSNIHNQKDNNSIINQKKYDNLINSDIINLSELNQNEIERDEIIMNNQYQNNQIVNEQGMNMQQEQVPTFGGRFFPSLEDEPTNMNMGTIPTTNNNLIDLTNDSNENPVPLQQISNQPIQPQMPQENINTLNQMNEMTSPNSMPSPEMVMNQQMPNPVSPVMPSNDFNVPPQMEPKFDMTQSVTAPVENIAPQIEPQMVPPIQPTMTSEVVQNNMNDYSQMQNPNNLYATDAIPQNEFAQPVIEQPINNNQNMNYQQEPLPQNEMKSPQMELPQDMIQEQPTIMEPVVQTQSVDVTPAKNMIMSVANSLREFGYNINLSEEDLETSNKIIIELLK